MEDIIKEAYEIDTTGDVSADYMTDILTDTDTPTYGMYEDLYCLYKNKTPEEKYLIDRVLGILTGHNMTEIATEIVNKVKENKK